MSDDLVRMARVQRVMVRVLAVVATVTLLVVGTILAGAVLGKQVNDAQDATDRRLMECMARVLSDQRARFADLVEGLPPVRRAQRVYQARLSEVVAAQGRLAVGRATGNLGARDVALAVAAQRAYQQAADHLAAQQNVYPVPSPPPSNVCSITLP